MPDFFSEFLADVPDVELGKEKVCDIYIQKVFNDPMTFKGFKWGVSVMRFSGNDLEEAKTLATFVNYKLALDFAKKVRDAFENKGYEIHLKGEIDE